MSLKRLGSSATESFLAWVTLDIKIKVEGLQWSEKKKKKEKASQNRVKNK